MDDSMGAGLVAVIVVSGSIVFLSLQVHKRLLSEFMEKIEFELGSGKDETKKRVRFSSQQVENRDRQINEIESKKKGSSGGGSRSRVVIRDIQKHGQMEEGSMPGNWQALYKGILQHRKLSTPCI
ncbi:hypothetical protein POM88_017927 [Heracleum sosnowskyi]|uniref:Uncharacterized protein n=1 Tax=Heracleum sosnowskyi TaxID=360622 RepID=A0AAD8MYF6_9APIA|nr:hypothetical protein POM88_017927 [Heracleum sosnowskyi]